MLKIFSNPCCKQKCCHPGFVVPFIEHRQDRFSISLKGPRILKATARLLIGLISIFSCLRELGGPRRVGERGDRPIGGAIRTHTTLVSLLSYMVHGTPKQLQQ